MTQLPIRRVVVMEDRAQVERQGEIAITGTQRFEISGLSLLAVDRSLTVEVSGATLVDAKLERRFRQRPPGGLKADASELAKTVHSLERQLIADQDAMHSATTGRELVRQGRETALRSISQLAGYGEADDALWTEQLDVLTAEQQRVERAFRDARDAVTRTSARLNEARTALQVAERGEEGWECFLVLTCLGNGPATVSASYLVPCALWRPAYRASLLEEGSSGRVEVEADAVVWQRTGEDWAEVELRFSTARPTLGTTPPTLDDDWLRTRPKARIEQQVVEVEVREEVIAEAGARGTDDEIPGVDDGGETRLLSAQGSTTIRSDGLPHRVALFGFDASAKVELQCPAELTNLVFVNARFSNESPQVLLAGPVDLIRRSGLVGRGLVPFTAPGEPIALSFGNEDGLEVIREVDESVDEARLTGRRVTKKRITLHVSNLRPAAATIVLQERVPLSEVKEIEVEVLAAECSPAPRELSREGVASLPVTLGPQGTTRATFAWRLSAAKKVAGL